MASKLIKNATERACDSALQHWHCQEQKTFIIMYIVAIAWIFVALMAAITERNLTAGVITFLFWGLFPLALFLWIAGTGERRRRRLLAEQAIHPPMRQGNSGDAQENQ